MKKKKKINRLYDFRIEYSAEDSVMTNYHYYNCESAEQALSFQREMMDHKDWDIEVLSIEKKNPYSNEWEDESEVLNSHQGK
jgi:hypothetical protein